MIKVETQSESISHKASLDKKLDIKIIETLAQRLLH